MTFALIAASFLSFRNLSAPTTMKWSQHGLRNFHQNSNSDPGKIEIFLPTVFQLYHERQSFQTEALNRC
jgi:hypothetical protein